MDVLLSKALDGIIRKDLGSSVISKIEDRLGKKYDLSLTQSIQQFHKLDSVLREFFGAGADSLEQKFIESIITIKSSSNKKYCNVTMEYPILTQSILEAIGDDEKKMIMDALYDKSLVISDVLEALGLPQTSGYRKFNSLISEGLLIKDGYIIGKDGKKINKYKSLFDNIKINIVKNKTKIDARIHNEDLESSSILQVVQAR